MLNNNNKLETQLEYNKNNCFTGLVFIGFKIVTLRLYKKYDTSRFSSMS